MRYIDRSNDDNKNNKNKQIQSNSWIWLIAFVAIGLAASFVLPFPISFVAAMVVFFLLNAVKMHITLKRQGVAGFFTTKKESKDVWQNISNRSVYGNSRDSDYLHHCNLWPQIVFTK